MLRLPGSQDEGFTLVEVLIAMVILGLAVTGLIAGFATTSQSASLYKDQSDGQTFLNAAAERVKLTTYDTTCGAAPYASAIAVLPASWTSRGGSITGTVTS